MNLLLEIGCEEIPDWMIPSALEFLRSKFPGENVRVDGTGRRLVVLADVAVRRLTPVECERLQGFPDDYTDIKPKGKDTPDGPRYKALGNSMAVPVMGWIGKRISEAA